MQKSEPPRKSYRSPDLISTPIQRFQTIMTPLKQTKEKTFNSNKSQKFRQQQKQCPFHFNQPSHICLTCRKTICLRCALTYCHHHTIQSQDEILPKLRQDIIRLQISPLIQEIQMKYRQSQDRQDYLQKKGLKLIQNIEQHFNCIVSMLNKKKLQIIQFYDDQFDNYLKQYRHYDEELTLRLNWLKKLEQTQQEQQIIFDPDFSSIENIDSLLKEIKIIKSNDKLQKKVTKMIMGKDKLKIQKLWSEQKLEKVLFEIQNINYKVENPVKVQKRKKRFTTENVADYKSHNPFGGVIKSTSNSRLPSNRRNQHYD